MKRKDVSGGAASSNDVLPKKKKTTDSMDSGVLQPTEFQVRIIFADGGWISARIAKSLIRDDRVHLETQDLLESAELFEASIIIGSNCKGDKGDMKSICTCCRHICFRFACHAMTTVHLHV